MRPSVRNRRTKGLPPPRPYKGPIAMRARVRARRLIVELKDGRTLVVPLGLIPGFARLPARAFANLEIVAGGVAIHFPAIDEDVGVENLLHPEQTLWPRTLPRLVSARTDEPRGQRASK